MSIHLCCHVNERVCVCAVCVVCAVLCVHVGVWCVLCMRVCACRFTHAYSAGREHCQARITQSTKQHQENEIAREEMRARLGDGSLFRDLQWSYAKRSAPGECVPCAVCMCGACVVLCVVLLRQRSMLVCMCG